MQYDERHGGPYDRGCADAYYRRAFRPHYFMGGDRKDEEVDEVDMTPDQINAYRQGFYDAQDAGFEKDWG